MITNAAVKNLTNLTSLTMVVNTMIRDKAVVPYCIIL